MNDYDIYYSFISDFFEVIDSICKWYSIIVYYIKGDKIDIENKYYIV